MKKIIFIITFLIIAVAGASYVYFQNILASNNNSEHSLKMLPKDAAIVFEFKNENSFYSIFKEYKLFNNIIGKTKMEELSEIKNILNEGEISETFNESQFYISIHQINNQVELLLLAPLSNKFLFKNSVSDLIEDISLKTNTIKHGKFNIYNFTLKNNRVFYFTVYKSTAIGSFNKNLILNTLSTKIKTAEIPKAYTFESSRNRNSIANLYVNYKQLPGLLQNLSKIPIKNLITNFDASSILNINYQSNAFMFNGITIPDTLSTQYQNLFLNQNPGELSFKNTIPFSTAKFAGFYISNTNIFQEDLKKYFIETNNYIKLQKHINELSQKHSFFFNKELKSLVGNDFGTFSLSNGENLGIISLKNIDRARFALSLISTNNNEINKLNESDIFYYLVGDPFKSFRKPYYAFINNYIILSNDVSSLKYVLNQYNSQNTLLNNKDYIEFQQYLTNRGNIFLYINKKNSNYLIKSYLKSNIYKIALSDEFKLNNWYGFSLQLSSDKDKFYTNLYLNSPDSSKFTVENQKNINIDSLYR